MLDQVPFDKVRVKDLTEACNMQRTTFYRHYDSVYDVMESVERRLLSELSLFKVPPEGSGMLDVFAELKTNPFDSMVRWFANGMRLRGQLKPVMGVNGDVYFRVRLTAQIRRELNSMMDYDGVPKGKLRPYYVELLAAAYVGVLSHLVKVEDEKDLITPEEAAIIANSVREAYFQCDPSSPDISPNDLYGSSDNGRRQLLNNRLVAEWPGTQKPEEDSVV